jgi:hypothetical protein
MILRSLCFALFLFPAMAPAALGQSTASAVSDSALSTLKALAWQSLPTKILQRNRTVLEIDKSDPSKVVISDEDAREVIHAAELTARAQECHLQELVIANRDALLLRMKKSGKWTEIQLQYVNALHLFTVQLLVRRRIAGQMPAFEERALPGFQASAGCSDEEKQKILNAVEANERLLGSS